MKKLLLVAALMMSMIQPALAMDGMNTQGDNQIAVDTNTQDLGFDGQQERRGSGGAVVGGIIGGVIGGLIIADALENGGHHHRPPHYPGRPGYGSFVCYAENMRGEVFRARGHRPRLAQEKALDKCYAYSRRCRPLGCDDRW